MPHHAMWLAYKLCYSPSQASFAKAGGGCSGNEIACCASCLAWYFGKADTRKPGMQSHPVSNILQLGVLNGAVA